MKNFATFAIFCALGLTSAFGQTGGSLSVGAGPKAEKPAIYAPRPEYPYEARRNNITGSGVVIVEVNKAGLVTSTRMRQSTGSPILDQAATGGFKKWRFKPGKAFSFWTPITFTMSGAQY